MDETPKLAVVMLSPDLEKLHAGALMGSVAAMSGMSVNIFVSMSALEVFRKDAAVDREFVHGTVGAELLRKRVPLFDDLLEQGRVLGDLRLYGCAMAMDLMGWAREDLIDGFTDIIGVTEFFSLAAGGQILTV